MTDFMTQYEQHIRNFAHSSDLRPSRKYWYCLSACLVFFLVVVGLALSGFGSGNASHGIALSTRSQSPARAPARNDHNKLITAPAKTTSGQTVSVKDTVVVVK